MEESSNSSSSSNSILVIDISSDDKDGTIDQDLMEEEIPLIDLSSDDEDGTIEQDPMKSSSSIISSSNNNSNNNSSDTSSNNINNNSNKVELLFNQFKNIDFIYLTFKDFISDNFLYFYGVGMNCSCLPFIPDENCKICGLKKSPHTKQHQVMM
jgi:hypothetical protein